MPETHTQDRQDVPGGLAHSEAFTPAQRRSEEDLQCCAQNSFALFPRTLAERVCTAPTVAA